MWGHYNHLLLLRNDSGPTLGTSLSVEVSDNRLTKLPLDTEHQSVGVWGQYLNMADGRRNNHLSLLGKPIAVLSGLPWLEVGEKAWQIIRNAVPSWSYSGMYEVLEYESTLELKDSKGERATFRKRRRFPVLECFVKLMISWQPEGRHRSSLYISPPA